MSERPQVYGIRRTSVVFLDLDRLDTLLCRYHEDECFDVHLPYFLDIVREDE